MRTRTVPGHRVYRVELLRCGSLTADGRIIMKLLLLCFVSLVVTAAGTVFLTEGVLQNICQTASITIGGISFLLLVMGVFD